MARKDVEDGNAGENHQASAHRAFEIVSERVVEKRRGDHDKERWNHRITPNAIRTLGLRLASTKNKYCTAGNHVEEPLRENRERKELPETTAEEQKDDCEPALHNQRNRGSAEAGMNLGNRIEKVSIPSHRKGHARPAHDGSV